VCTDQLVAAVHSNEFDACMCVHACVHGRVFVCARVHVHVCVRACVYMCFCVCERESVYRSKCGCCWEQ